MLPPQLSLQSEIGEGEEKQTLSVLDLEENGGSGDDENEAWQEAMDASYDNRRKVGADKAGDEGESPAITRSAERRRGLMKKDTLGPSTRAESGVGPRSWRMGHSGLTL